MRNYWRWLLPFKEAKTSLIRTDCHYYRFVRFSIVQRTCVWLINLSISCAAQPGIILGFTSVWSGNSTLDISINLPHYGDDCWQTAAPFLILSSPGRHIHHQCSINQRSHYALKCLSLLGSSCFCQDDTNPQQSQHKRLTLIVEMRGGEIVE